MSVDDRIRDGMIANATAHQPAVESSLDKVRERGRRAQTRRVVMAAGSVAAGSVAAVAAAVLILASSNAPDRTEPATPAPSATSALFGRYQADVTSPDQLAGHWVLEFGGNGTITVIPPEGYAGVVSGTLLSADGTTFRTNLFEQDVCAYLGNGEFRWTREEGRLALRVGHDPCAPRRTFFTGNRWVAVPGS